MTGWRQRLLVDMDGVLCNIATPFLKEKALGVQFPHARYGFFLELEPIPGAIEAVKKLETMYDVWILTRPSIKNKLCYTEKAYWIEKYLGEDMLNRTIYACDKSVVRGEFLVDDNRDHGQENGEFALLHFGTERFPDWTAVLEYLANRHYEDHIIR